MIDDAALLQQLRAAPDLLAAVAACSPAERVSQKSLRGRFPDALVRAALRLQEARERAVGRLPHADRLWLTRTALEQATAWAVAEHKAARFAGRGEVVDLCCGIGSDAAAISHHCRVTAVDRSPAMVLRATWNAEVLGRPERFAARCGDVTAEDWTGRFVHADPDRRDGRDRPARWLEHYQPGLDWMHKLVATARGGAIKVGPAGDFPGKFPGCEIELVSLGGECREATIWFGELAGPEPARATNLSTGESLAGNPASSRRSVADMIGGFLCDPDPAVVRAGLLDELALQHGMLRLDAEEEYLTAERLPVTSFVTTFAVEAVLPAGIKDLRRHLRQQPAHHYEIKCRRLAIDVEDVRRQLPTGDAPPCVVIFCRIGGRARAVIGRRCEPAG
jgi:SAM-dependent methyltransferase